MDNFQPFGGPPMDNFNLVRKPSGGTPFQPTVRRPVNKDAIPEAKELFTVQRDLLKALNHLRDSQAKDHDVDRARTDLEAAYRVLNRWMKTRSEQGRL